MDNSENYVENIKEIIIKSIDLYDRKCNKYLEIMTSRPEIIKDINKIRFYSKNDELLLEANYQYAGYYDTNNNIWVWAWLLPLTNNNTKLSRDLLQYGLKLDVDSINNDQIFIKNLLLNSRFIIKDKIGLDINLAIFSFILKEKILFIYPHVINDITIYYFITD